ncbi:hypothetical protein EOS_35495 [Caballeronia mineralivorans PML1(12)]|uniref:Uncharacterized protein n=2 Tax=Caballeronia mineralivorans TaxID=2010198 RepID=A0A0J1CL82_9BURK|nr:hypothetical protein EOS_35495 [Caballeronia mineralivorans PML1(12)]
MKFNDTEAMLKCAFAKIELGNAPDRRTEDRVSESMKAAFGIRNRCDDDVFTLIAQHLSENKSVLFPPVATSASVDVAAVIYLLTAGMEGTFANDGSLDHEAFVQFVAARVGTNPDIVRTQIPAEYLRAISRITGERRSMTPFESEITKAGVQLNHTEFWVAIPAGFELSRPADEQTEIKALDEVKGLLEISNARNNVFQGAG